MKPQRTVSYTMARSYRAKGSVPLIRMRGHWLASLGFQIGAIYTVRSEGGKIILSAEPQPLPSHE